MKNIKISRTPRPTRKVVPLPTNTPQRILVVDDDADIRQLNTEVLRESGYHVDNAPDGEVAWHALQSKAYDLLITDNNMPQMTGIELVNKLRSEEMKLPIILMSGTMPSEELKRHPWLQIQGTLLKPYTLAELFVTVKEVLCCHDSVLGLFTPSNWQKRANGESLRI